MKILLADNETTLEGIVSLQESFKIDPNDTGSIEMVINLNKSISPEEIRDLNSKDQFCRFTLLDENGEYIETWKSTGSLVDIHSIYTDKQRRLTLLFRNSNQSRGE